MKEVRIVQKDFVTHTTFMVTPEGRVYPDANYKIALRWKYRGLLCESSGMKMREIAEAVAAGKSAKRAKEKGKKELSMLFP